MLRCFIDLETLPTQTQWIKDEIYTNIKPPGNIKKPESIIKWAKDNADSAYEAAYLKTSFDGGSGEICTIGASFYGEEPISYQRNNETSESDILQLFFQDLSNVAADEYKTPEQLQIQWIGHNVLAFDLRFLYQRCVILGIDTFGIKIPVNERHGSRHVYDTLAAWQGWKVQPGGSMERLCRLFGIAGKGDVDGSMIWPMFQSGMFDQIAEYCKGDVKRTIELYNRLTFGANHA